MREDSQTTSVVCVTVRDDKKCDYNITYF